MCYTIELYLSRKQIEERFSVDTSALYDFDFRYFFRAFNNPFMPVVTQDKPEEVQLMQWGLIPHWVNDYKQAEKIRRATYNARGESLNEKPSFRKPFETGRCWVLGHGFFESQHREKSKTPWYISLKNSAPFAFAGLFDTWRDPESEEILNTFSVITIHANPLMERIHNTKKRMPVILNPEKEKEWLASDSEVNRLKTLISPYPEEELKAHPVSGKLYGSDTDPHDISVIREKETPQSGILF